MAQTFKYLDLTGLTKYDELIKNYIGTEINSKDSAMGGRVEALETWKTTAQAEITSNTNAWTAFLAGISKESPAPTLAQINTAINTTLPEAIAKAQTDAEATAKAYTDAREIEIDKKWAAADTALHNTITGEIATAKSGAEATAKGYTDEREIEIDKKWAAADATLKSDLEAYADQAEAEAKSHADGLNTAMDARVVVLEAYDKNLTDKVIPGLEKGIEDAEANAKSHTNTEIAKLNATTLKMSGDEGAETIANEITSLKGSISGGTFFKGVVPELPSNGEGYKNGDIIVVGALEFIWDETQNEWVELGDPTGLGQRISKITITGDTDNTYVDVDTTKSGDNWTLTVDESKLSTKIANLEKADTDNLAEAKKHATDLVEALDAELNPDAEGAGEGEVAVVTGVNLTQVDGKITALTVDSGKAATKAYVDGQITDAKSYTDGEIAKLGWEIDDTTTENEAKFIGGITVVNGIMTAKSINTITSIDTESIEALFA